MTALNTAEFKARLLEQRSSLMTQLSNLRGGNIGRVEASAAHFSGREDSPAQTTTEKEIEFAMDDHDTAEIAAVQAALQRIDNGVYGECVDCGTQIPEARLRAAPEAARCIQCQERAEKA